MNYGSVRSRACARASLLVPLLVMIPGSLLAAESEAVAPTPEESAAPVERTAFLDDSAPDENSPPSDEPASDAAAPDEPAPPPLVALPPEEPAPSPTKPSESAASAAAPAAESAAAPRSVRIAVSELESPAGSRIGIIFSDAIVAELRKLNGVSVIGMNEIRAMLAAEADREAMGCDTDESCIAEIADALGAEVLIVGGVADVGEEHLVVLKRIEQAEARVIRSVTKRVQKVGNGEDVLAVVGDTVQELFPYHELRPGQTRGVDKEFVARLNPPPLQPFVIFAAGGVAGALGLAALVSLNDSGLARAGFESKASAPVVDGAELRALEDRGRLADTLAISLAAGSALTAGLTIAAAFFLTDWYGFGEER